jgi:small subunit ribosomal protein S2
MFPIHFPGSRVRNLTLKFGRWFGIILPGPAVPDSRMLKRGDITSPDSTGRAGGKSPVPEGMKVADEKTKGKKNMPPVTMKALLETGVHFGHRTSKWNAKMKPYIFTERNGIHIIDLQQTLKAVNDVYDLVRDTTMNGGSVLLVGTKRQAQETIAQEATRCGMPYVNERWLGGTLTNWRTIRQRIDYLTRLEERRDQGEFELLTKKEALTLIRKIEKLNVRLGGIRNMKGLPSLLFIIDVRREYTAVREANILDIPAIAMVDTNCDPDLIDYVIPSNDDAIRAIKLITSVIADAVLEGVALRKDEMTDEELMAGEMVSAEYAYEGPEEDADDEDFLGQATLAKLRSGELSFEEEEEAKAKAKAKVEEETEEEAEDEAPEIEEAEETSEVAEEEIAAEEESEESAEEESLEEERAEEDE